MRSKEPGHSESGAPEPPGAFGLAGNEIPSTAIGLAAEGLWFELRPDLAKLPRRSQLEPGLIERGTVRLNRLRRAAVLEFIPWNGSSGPEAQMSPPMRESRDPLKLARYYQSMLDSGKFENRAALARFLGVSRARITQVLRRLQTTN